MTLEWILSPVTLYSAMPLLLWGCLAVVLSARVELKTVRRRAKQSADAAEAEMLKLTAEVQQLRETGSPIEVNRVSAGSRGLTQVKRGHALRLHRRGEPLQDIAAAVQATKGEIELFLKVNQLINSGG